MAKKNIKETEQTLKECLAELVSDNEPLLTDDDLDKLTALNNAAADVLYNRELMDRLTAINRLDISNPAVQFTKDAQNGVFDDVSNDSYNDLLEYTAKVSDFWNSKAYVSSVANIDGLARDLIDVRFVINSVVRVFNAVLLSSALQDYETSVCDTEVCSDAGMNVMNDDIGISVSDDEWGYVPDDELPESDDQLWEESSDDLFLE